MVGNHDDASELFLTQLQTLDNTTPWEKGAVIEAERLTKELGERWRNGVQTTPLFHRTYLPQL